MQRLCQLIFRHKFIAIDEGNAALPRINERDPSRNGMRGTAKLK
jgi:hypothetical protein